MISGTYDKLRRKLEFFVNRATGRETNSGCDEAYNVVDDVVERSRLSHIANPTA